jgi:hypothetical protein
MRVVLFVGTIALAKVDLHPPVPEPSKGRGKVLEGTHSIVK